jgi:ABC-2 type transport system ATP-binding protein
MSPSPLLKVDRLSVRRGELQVLKSLSFEVREGEIFGLLGPNGSGKSTTFSVLTGLLSAQKGEMQFKGEAISGGERALLKELGVVFQNPSLDPNLSARENLAMTAKLYRIPKAQQNDRIDELLRLADLIDRADERVSTYSGGMRRRLELSRSLIHQPKLLMMDEPTTGLDEGAFQRTWRRLLKLRDEQGVSILLSTHRPEEAAFCDRIGFILDGELVVCDTPKALQALVSEDRVSLQCQRPEFVVKLLKEALNLEGQATDHTVTLTCEEGHTLIPRIVEALPSGEIHSIQMTRPNLGDVFLHLTGETLSEESA